MLCKLCKKDSILCCESHIIPGFMYTELFDTKHKLLKISLGDAREKAVSTGEYEGGILCLACEAQLCRYETYARIVLFGGNPGKKEVLSAQNYINQHGVQFTHIAGLNYTKFKLFLLSILWRASISSRPFFSKVNLGPYEETLRENLLAENPGPTHFFPCVLSTYRKHGLPVEIVGEPRKIKTNPTSYSFLIGGILYQYYVTLETTEEWVLEATPNQLGEMRVLHMSEVQGKRILNSFIGANLLM